MKQQLQDLTMRPPTEVDAQIVVDLMIACDIAEYGEADSSLDDLQYEWTLIDLDQDAWLAFTPDIQLVGYAALFKDDTDFSFDFYTHPSFAGDDLQRHFLAQGEARATAQLAEARESEGDVTTIISQVNTTARQVLEQGGFEPQTYHFRMQIESNTLPAAPAWPDGYTLRTIVPGQDDQLVYDFIQTAFDQPGRVPPSFESWREYMMRADHFVNELWFLLFDQEGLIGAALCYDYPEFGWVRQLGVASSRRGQGVGSALLQHVFRVFFERGHKKVALGVDSTRPQAQSLYENVGMVCVRRYDEYHKAVCNKVG